MEQALKDLATRLHDLRRRSNRATLSQVLASAGILLRAKEIAKRRFGRWVREEAHMQYDTAHRYLRVWAFMKVNHDLNSEIATLSISKLYALSSLDSDTARHYLTGREGFSKPLEGLTDVEFLREFRERFPRQVRRRTRVHVYQEISAALSHLRKALGRGQKYARVMSPLQRQRIARELDTLGAHAAFWKDRRGAG